MQLVLKSCTILFSRIRTRSKTRTNFCSEPQTNNRQRNFALRSTAELSGEWAFAPVKTSIDMLPDWLTGSAKTSGDVA